MIYKYFILIYEIVYCLIYYEVGVNTLMACVRYSCLMILKVILLIIQNSLFNVLD